MGSTFILPYSQYSTVNTEQAVNLGEDQLGLWRKQAAYTDGQLSNRLSKLDQDANELWSQQLQADQQRGIPLTVTHPHRVGGQVNVRLQVRAGTVVMIHYDLFQYVASLCTRTVTSAMSAHNALFALAELLPVVISSCMSFTGDHGCHVLRCAAVVLPD